MVATHSYSNDAASPHDTCSKLSFPHLGKHLCKQSSSCCLCFGLFLLKACLQARTCRDLLALRHIVDFYPR